VCARDPVGADLCVRPRWGSHIGLPLRDVKRGAPEGGEHFGVEPVPTHTVEPWGLWDAVRGVLW